MIKKLDRRQHGRFKVIYGIEEDVMMYLSPPLIQDPVPVTIHDLSAGGLSLETSAPIPSRFLFTIIFTPEGMNKIYAEGKAVHVQKTEKGYKVGVAFTKIESDVVQKINRIARDVNTCDKRIQAEEKIVCKTACRYHPLCRRKDKI
ncbi:MAG: PilZ domain-containing protein [bacterium]